MAQPQQSVKAAYIKSRYQKTKPDTGMRYL